MRQCFQNRNDFRGRLAAGRSWYLALSLVSAELGGGSDVASGARGARGVRGDTCAAFLMCSGPFCPRNFVMAVDKISNDHVAQDPPAMHFLLRLVPTQSQRNIE